MQIISPEVKHLVHDYDITFDNGTGVQLTINPDLGDTITFTDRTLLAFIAPRPEPLKLPAQDITIFLSKIISIQHREREQIELSPEQKAQFEKALQEYGMPKSVM